MAQKKHTHTHKQGAIPDLKCPPEIGRDRDLPAGPPNFLDIDTQTGLWLLWTVFL